MVKWVNGMDFVILGIENPDKIHYAMPLRCRIYDDLQYLKQVQEIVAKNKKRKIGKILQKMNFCLDQNGMTE